MSVQEAIAAGLTTQEIQDALAIVNEAREEFKQAERKQKEEIRWIEYYKIYII